MHSYRINNITVCVRSLSQVLLIVFLLGHTAGALTGCRKVLPEPIEPLTAAVKVIAPVSQILDNAMAYDGSLEARQVLVEAAKAAASVPDQKGDSKRAKVLQSRKETSLLRIANARVRAGDIQGALETAEGNNLLHVSRTVAIAQARNGSPKDALKAFPPYQYKNDIVVLKFIIEAFLKAGDSKGALEIAGENAILLGFIARQQALAGDPSHKELFRKVISRVNSSRGRDRQDSAGILLRLAKFQAQAGDHQESQEILKQSVAVFGEVGRWIDDQHQYVKALQTVATTYWELGNREEGRRRFDQALDACGLLHPGMQVWEMMNIANTFVKLGAPVLANSVIERLRKTSDKFPKSEQINALDRIAKFQAAGGDREGSMSTFHVAVAVTNTIDDPRWFDPLANALKATGVNAIAGTRSGGRFSISWAAAEAGAFELAFDVANSIEDDRAKAQALRLIAFELVKTKKGEELEQGLQALSQSVERIMPSPFPLFLSRHNDNLLIELGAIQAALGDIKAVLRLGRAAREDMQRFVYSAALGMLNAKQNFVGAQQVYAEMEDGRIELDSVYGHTRSQAKTGYYKRALDWAKEQASPLIQANALAGLAEGMMDLAGVPVMKPFGMAEEW